MSDEARVQLETMVREAQEMTGALAAAVEELKAAGQPLPQTLVAYGRSFVAKVELAMSLNAGLFEAAPNPEAKERHLKIDDAFRFWKTTIKEMLALPRREG